jgi:hypothetical protein
VAQQKVNGVLNIEDNFKQLKLIVPLPSKGKRVFTLPTGQIRSLIDDMKMEDSTVQDVDILDKNGLRIARSTNINHLLEHDWKLRINDQTYYVLVPSTTANTGKQGKSNIEKIRDWFNQKKEEQNILDYQEFVYKCQDLGINEAQGKEILRELSKEGVAFYYENNLELREKILLAPKKLSAALERSFNIDFIKLNLADKRAFIEKLRAEIGPLEQLHAGYKQRANSRIRTISYVLLVGLCAQWLLFARLTWWDYSWDVIEPVTYFTTAVQMILAGYAYYLVYREDYTNMEVKKTILNKFLRRYKQRDGFDEDKFLKLKSKIDFCEKELISETTESK